MCRVIIVHIGYQLYEVFWWDEIEFSFNGLNVRLTLEPDSMLFPGIVVFFPVSEIPIAAETFDDFTATSVEETSIAELFGLMF